MSDLIQRRRLIRQLGEQSNVRLLPVEHGLSHDQEVTIPHFSMFDFDDEHIAEFLSMDTYLSLEVGVGDREVVEQIEMLRQRFDAEQTSLFFTESRNRLIGTVANKFMLGGIVAQKDRDGGSVDTIHNVRVKDENGNLRYASDATKQKYDQRGIYNDKEYHGDQRYVDANRKYSQERKEGNLEDRYTGRRFGVNESPDLDHTISAKEIHDDPGRVLAGLDGPELANREANLNPTDPSVNRSKKAMEAEQFLQRLEREAPARKAKIEELKRRTDLTDKEKKELRKLEQHESIDADKLRKLDQASRKEYEAMINKKYYLSKDFLGNVGKTSVKEGARMGFQQLIGIFLTETIAAVFDEIKDAVKHRYQRTKSFWNELKDRLETVVKRIVGKWKEALKEGFTGLLSGIFSNIVTVIINTFLTTAKNIVRLIREGFFSIVKAVKMLLNPPAGMTRAQVFHEAGKIIIAALAVSVGILLEETVDKLPPMKMIRSIPVVGELLYSVVFGFMVGLVTTLALWGWDKLDLFGVKEDARHQFVMDMLKQDQERLLENRKAWLERMKNQEPERYFYLTEELKLV